MVDEKNFVPRAVNVSLPALETGVKCLVDGHEVKDRLQLKPGSYSCVYQRSGYRDQRIEFKVEIAEDCTLPSPKAWSANPVKVSIPQLDASVTCRVDGRPVSAGEAPMLDPGEHSCTYERADYLPQTQKFTVVAAKEMTLAAPKDWVKSPGLIKLDEAEQKFKSGNWREVEPLLSSVEVFSTVNLARKLTLEELVNQKKVAFAEEEKKKKVALEERARKQSANKDLYDQAIIYFEGEDYGQAIKIFHEAVQGGYVLSASDMKKVESAYATQKDRLDKLINRCYKMVDLGRTPLRPIKDLEEERKQLMDWHTALKSAFRPE